MSPQPAPLSIDAFLETQIQNHFRSADLCTLIMTLAQCGGEIAQTLRCGELSGAFGQAESGQNISGDEQKKLDVLADRLLIDRLKDTSSVAIVGSEESDDLINSNPDGKFAVLFDPLDGSSNIDAHIPTGTIFAIWKAEAFANGAIPDGTSLIASGYILYSSAVVLTATIGGKPFQAVCSPDGAWIVTHEEITLPTTFACYSVNEANFDKWDPDTQALVLNWRTKGSGRYIGSMVADIHRNLLYGGVFAYPKDVKNTNGKLRTMYEGYPMALLFEKAGGAATDGEQRLLERASKSLHDKTPVFIGHATHLQVG